MVLPVYIILSILFVLGGGVVILAIESERLRGKTAFGVPRRFGMTALFAIVTFYGVVFAVMKSLDFHAIGFTIFAVFLTCVGLGQALLFGGKSPRAASVCVGAVLFPMEIMALIVYDHLSSPDASFSGFDFVGIIFLIVLCILAGSLLGYLAGGLIGGVFVLLDLIARKTRKGNDEVAGEE